LQLQGAELSVTQLQGTNLSYAQLQGAKLSAARLQGASLDSAQLHGAELSAAQLQGASLSQTQLQGANLSNAELEGASLTDNFVWRTGPPLKTEGAFVSRPQPGPKYSGLDCRIGKCDWSETSYAALKSLIEKSLPAGPLRDQALERIAILEKPPYVADEASAKAWMDLAEESASPNDSFVTTRAKVFKEIGCAADGAPYVMGALIRQLDDQFLGYIGPHLAQEAEVAAAFLDEAKCPGALGLSEENKAKLREIRDRPLPASSRPNVVAR
jgi:uncharacterized protein YjbI with pentapeptide repeats